MEGKGVVFFANECNIVNSVCSPYNYLFLPGTYLLEVWGASGGNSTITYNNDVSPTPAFGGKGGYSKGIIKIYSRTLAFLYVGEQGFVVKEVGINSRGTFGGGGNLTITTSQAGHACIGGGSSDIRLNEDNIFNRVIVAGAGGGASGGWPNIYVNGGDAGGSEGFNGYCDTEPEKYFTNGGTQTSGGSVHGDKWGTGTGYDGTFGLGGGSRNYNTNYGGSGGGGWFGGAGGGHRVSGAGGSGYAFTSSSYKPTGFKLSDKYYLKSSSVLDGRTSFPKATEKIIVGNHETGHVGNGAIRITCIINLSYSCKKKTPHNIFVIILIINYCS